MNSIGSKNVISINSDSNDDERNEIPHFKVSPLKDEVTVSHESDDEIFFLPRQTQKMIDGDDLPRKRRERRHSKKHARSTKSTEEECRSFNHDSNPPRIPPLPDLSEVLPSLYGISNNDPKKIVYRDKLYHNEKTVQNSKQSDHKNAKSVKKKRKSVDWYKTQSNAILGELFSVSSPSVTVQQSVDSHQKHSENKRNIEHHKRSENKRNSGHHRHDNDHHKLLVNHKSDSRIQGQRHERNRNNSDSSVVEKHPVHKKLFPQYSIDETSIHQHRRRRSSLDKKKHDSKKRHIHNNHYNNSHHQKKMKRDFNMTSRDRKNTSNQIEKSYSCETDHPKTVRFVTPKHSCDNTVLKRSLSSGDQTIRTDILNIPKVTRENDGAFGFLESLSQSGDDSSKDSCYIVSPRSQQVPLKKCVTLLSDVMQLPCLNECKQKLNNIFINLSVLKHELARHEDREKHIRESHQPVALDRHFLDVISVPSDGDDDKVAKSCDSDSLTVDLLSVSDSTDDEVNMNRTPTHIMISDSETSHSFKSVMPAIPQTDESVTNKSSIIAGINEHDIIEVKSGNMTTDKKTSIESEGLEVRGEFVQDFCHIVRETPPELEKIDKQAKGSVIRENPPVLVMVNNMSNQKSTKTLSLNDNEMQSVVTEYDGDKNPEHDKNCRSDRAIDNNDGPFIDKSVKQNSSYSHDSETTKHDITVKKQTKNTVLKIFEELDHSSSLDSGEEDSSKNIGMNYSFKSDDFSDVSGDEGANKTTDISSININDNVLYAKDDVEISAVKDEIYSDISKIDGNFLEISYKSELYSDVSDDGKNVKDFFVKSDKYSDVSGDEEETGNINNNMSAQCNVRVNLNETQCLFQSLSAELQPSFTDDYVHGASVEHESNKENHLSCSKDADIDYKQSKSKGLSILKTRQNIFEIMNDSVNSATLSDIYDSDIELPAFDMDSITHKSDQEAFVIEDSNTSSDEIDIEQTITESGFAETAAEIETESCKFPQCASTSRVESEKVPSAHEIHRHLEPSSPHPSTCDNIFSRLSTIVSSPNSIQSSHVEVTPQSLQVESNTVYSRTSVHNTSSSLQSSSPEENTHTSFHQKSLEDSSEPSHNLLFKQSSQVKDTNKPLQITWEDTLKPSQNRCLEEDSHQVPHPSSQNTSPSPPCISPLVDDTSICSTSSSSWTGNSSSRDTFITPDKPFSHLNRKSRKRKVRCSTRMQSTTRDTQSIDLTPVRVNDYHAPSLSMNNKVSQLSYYIQGYVHVGGLIHKDITEMPDVCKNMLHCFCDDGLFNVNVDHALKFVKHCVNRYYLTTDIVQSLLKSTFQQDSEKYINTCLSLVTSFDDLYPGHIHISWDDLNSCLGSLICKKDEGTERDQVNKLQQLKLFTHILRNNLYSKSLSDSREIRNADAYKLLRFDSLTSRKTDLLYYVHQALDGENFKETSTELLEQLQALLSLCVECSSSCVDCANSLAEDLISVYLSQPHLAAKHRLLHTMSSPLLKYKLVQHILENEYRDTIPFCSFPNSLKQVIEGFFWATPLKENSHDEDKISLYLPIDTEELAMLLYNAVESYLQVSQGRLHMALRRRCHYISTDNALLDADKEELARLPDHVTSLEKHLRGLTPNLTSATEHYLMMIDCLSLSNSLIETDLDVSTGHS